MIWADRPCMCATARPAGRRYHRRFYFQHVRRAENVISYGVPMKQAVKSATINPAKSIRVDDVTGSIKTGKLADLLVLDDELNIKLVMVRGQIKVNNL